MNSTRIGIIVIIVAIMATGLFFYLNKTKDTASPVEMEDEEYEKTMGKLDFFELNNEVCHAMNGLKAPDIQCSTKEESPFLSSFVKDKPILIYRYSELNCRTCFETELQHLQQYFPENDRQAIILCSYLNESDFQVFKRMNKIRLPIYRIDSDAFGWIADEKDSPYYFVLYPDMKVSQFYIPEKAYPEMNTSYLEGIKRLLADS